MTGKANLKLIVSVACVRLAAALLLVSISHGINNRTYCRYTFKGTALLAEPLRLVEEAVKWRQMTNKRSCPRRKYGLEVDDVSREHGYVALQSSPACMIPPPIGTLSKPKPY